jgi:hypothetical protein
MRQRIKSVNMSEQIVVTYSWSSRLMCFGGYALVQMGYLGDYLAQSIPFQPFQSMRGTISMNILQARIILNISLKIMVK